MTHRQRKYSQIKKAQKARLERLSQEMAKAQERIRLATTWAYASIDWNDTTTNDVPRYYTYRYTNPTES